MRRNKALIILTIFNIILFVLSTIAYFGTKENLEIFNSTGNVFEYEEREKGNVYLALNLRERVALVFDETSVKVSSAYRYDDRPEMVEIIRFIRYYSEVNGFEISRRNSDLWGEMRLHTTLYKMGYREAKTKNAEIDYEKDERWYVNVLGNILGWIGI